MARCSSAWSAGPSSNRPAATLRMLLRDLPQLSAQRWPPLQDNRVETDVEALERGAGAGGSTTDDDDVVMLIGRHVQLNDPVG